MMEKRRGHYLGTEIEEKWWKRYRKDGFFARGFGEFWCDEGAFYFSRYLMTRPLIIPFEKILGFQIGAWHAGRWSVGRPIIKISWRGPEGSLSSGFVLSNSEAHALEIIEEIRDRVPRRKPSISLETGDRGAIKNTIP